jgi:hypothetical protein
MSEQETKTNGQSWCQQLLFLRIFQGFRLAVQPGKLAVALLGVILLFFGGWVIDLLTPQSAMVLTDVDAAVQSAGDEGLNPQAYSELEAYVMENPMWLDKSAPNPRKDPGEYRKHIRDKNETAMVGFLSNPQLEMKSVAEAEKVREGKALKEIKDDYKEELDGAFEALEECYDARMKVIEDLDDEDKQEEEKIQLQRVRKEVTAALLGDVSAAMSQGRFSNVLMKGLKDENQKTAQKNLEKIGKTIELSMGYQVAQIERGEGVFETFVAFKCQRLTKAIKSLVTLEFAEAKSQLYQLVMGACWMSRTHPIIGGILMLYCLALYAVIGGALCRMAALQFARDERIGAWRALQYSLGKFGSYFTAPLIPVGIIVFVAIFIFLGGLLGAIPVAGEILAPILMGLALFGGFVIALVTVGLMAGYNLMYPTIAVEGSDSFDAISRAFSYIFARPWRMGFYSLVAAVYGGICYAFVRVFAWLLLLSVHVAAGAGMNWDTSSITGPVGIRGKLDAIWPTPTLGDLQPSINWATLNWSECFGAAVIWIWAALVVGLVLAFVMSFFYSANTVIYCLLRKKVDDTDLEDIYVEQDVDELVGEDESSAEESASSEEAAPADSGPEEASPEGEAGEGEDSSGEDEGLEKTE